MSGAPMPNNHHMMPSALPILLSASKCLLVGGGAGASFGLCPGSSGSETGCGVLVAMVIAASSGLSPTPKAVK